MYLLSDLPESIFVPRTHTYTPSKITVMITYISIFLNSLKSELHYSYTTQFPENEFECGNRLSSCGPEFKGIAVTLHNCFRVHWIRITARLHYRLVFKLMT